MSGWDVCGVVGGCAGNGKQGATVVTRSEEVQL